MRVIAVLPARHGSTRLPRKPLLTLGDRPLIQHAYENVLKSQAFAETWVVTDHEEIRKAVEKFGGRVMMSPESLQSGTDRMAWAARSLKADAFFNVQGDEPAIEPKILQNLVAFLSQNQFPMVTASTSLHSTEDWKNPSTVKCVANEKSEALLFTRAPIGYTREAPPLDWKLSPVRRHLGLYGFTHDALFKFTSLEPPPIEKAESLEQLRALHYGIPIGILSVESQSFGIDTEEDLERMRKQWRNQKNTSS